LIKTTFGKKRFFAFLSAKKRYPQSKKTFFAPDDVIENVGDPALGT
jgi:hypothetical protein